ncbi:MAG: major capsid protein [Pedobacter sp.]
MNSIRNLFTAAAIVQYLKSLPVIRTPVIDTVFANRPQLGLPLVGRDDVNTVVRAMPLTRRGAPSISIAAGTGQADFFEPFPINPDVFVGAHDINNLKLLGPASKQAWAQQKTDLLRRTIRETTEAMAAIAITGTLAWPVQLEGGAFDTYQVVFGTPVAYVPDKKWDAADAKISHVMQQLQDMQEALQDNGYGSVIEFWAGKTAYGALLVLAEKVTTTAKVRVEISDKGIDIGGFLVKRRTEKHRNPQTGAMVPTVADNDLVAIAMDAGHVMPYAALDDLDANLQPLPMFVKPIEKQNPSGIQLVGNSKPFPSPNMKGIAKATVTG